MDRAAMLKAGNGGERGAARRAAPLLCLVALLVLAVALPAVGQDLELYSVPDGVFVDEEGRAHRDARWVGVWYDQYLDLIYRTQYVNLVRRVRSERFPGGVPDTVTVEQEENFNQEVRARLADSLAGVILLEHLPFRFDQRNNMLRAERMLDGVRLLGGPEMYLPPAPLGLDDPGYRLEIEREVDPVRVQQTGMLAPDGRLWVVMKLVPAYGGVQMARVAWIRLYGGYFDPETGFGRPLGLLAVVRPEREERGGLR